MCNYRHIIGHCNCQRIGSVINLIPINCPIVESKTSLSGSTNSGIRTRLIRTTSTHTTPIWIIHTSSKRVRHIIIAHHLKLLLIRCWRHKRNIFIILRCKCVYTTNTCATITKYHINIIRMIPCKINDMITLISTINNS